MARSPCWTIRRPTSRLTAGDDAGKLSGGEIAAIIIACLLFVALLLGVHFLRRSKRLAKMNEMTSKVAAPVVIEQHTMAGVKAATPTVSETAGEHM